MGNGPATPVSRDGRDRRVISPRVSKTSSAWVVAENPPIPNFARIPANAARATPSVARYPEPTARSLAKYRDIEEKSPSCFGFALPPVRRSGRARAPL